MAATGGSSLGGSAGESSTGTGGGSSTGDSTPGPYVWKNVEIVGGGYVPGIVFSAIEPGLIYARTDIGGAYRWDEGSKRWIPLLDWVGFDEWNLLGVESIAPDPVEPDRVYLAVGMYTNSWTDQNGEILRSDDRGRSFSRHPLPFKLGGNMPGRSMGERLAIDPNQNSILYLGARSGHGLWRSLDYGASWSKVESLPSSGSFVLDPSQEYTSDPIGVVWVVFDPRSGTPGSASQTLYVGVAERGPSIYRSTDAGSSWQALPGQPQDGLLPHHAVLTSTGILYVTYSDSCGPYDGQKGDVWKFDTGSEVWTRISPVPSTSEDNYFGYGGLAVDASQPDVLVVSSLNSWWPDARFYRSTDGGQTWSELWSFGSYPERINRYEQDISAAPWLDWGTVAQPPETQPKLGWMTGDVDIDPFNPDRMLYGTGATVYGTDDLTAWDRGGPIHISVMAQGIEETAVLDLVSPPEGPVLLSALGDIGGFRHDRLDQVPMRMFTSPTIANTTSLDFAELNPRFVVRVGRVDKAENPDRAAIGISQDGGENWYAGAEISSTAEGGTVAVAADASSVVWAPISPDPVSYSTSQGSSWQPSSGIVAGAEVESDRVNPRKFYGCAGGIFYLSTDGGASFVQTPATGLPSTGALDFRAVPGIEGDIWLAGGEKDGVYGLWHSVDSGASFEKLDNVEAADVVGLGKPAPGASYPAVYINGKVAGVRGLFRSDDAGASWVRINDDQHQYGCANTVLIGDPRVYGRVYLGTNGRGIIYGDIRQ